MRTVEETFVGIEMVLDSLPHDSSYYFQFFNQSFGIFKGVFVLFGGFVMAYAMVLASALLHKNLLNNILHSPMAFFDVTPLGRIINRFGRDVDILDNTMVKNREGNGDLFDFN